MVGRARTHLSCEAAFYTYILKGWLYILLGNRYKNTHFIIINNLHLHKVHFHPQIAGASLGGGGDNRYSSLVSVLYLWGKFEAV